MTLTRRISAEEFGQKDQAFLVVRDGPDKGTSVEITATLVIGTQPGSGLTLTDPTVSRTHAEVSRTAQGFLLQDLGSTNGTFLNGVRVDRAYLREGAVLTMGKTDLLFRSDRAGKVFRDAGPSGLGEMVAVSDSMQRAFALLEGLSASDVTVLIEGETGTGKELASRAIHDRSPRARGPFVVFDCSTVPSELMESELFGHVKGAFTGAAESRKGAVEEADGGTLFLDEIGELPINLQPKLLRLLDRYGEHRRSFRHRHEQESRFPGEKGAVPQGPAVPRFRGPGCAAPPERTPGGHTSPGPLFHGENGKDWIGRDDPRPGRHGDPEKAPVAGKRP